MQIKYEVFRIGLDVSSFFFFCFRRTACGRQAWGKEIYCPLHVAKLMAQSFLRPLFFFHDFFWFCLCFSLAKSQFAIWANFANLQFLHSCISLSHTNTNIQGRKEGRRRGGEKMWENAAAFRERKGRKRAEKASRFISLGSDRMKKGNNINSLYYMKTRRRKRRRSKPKQASNQPNSNSLSYPTIPYSSVYYVLPSISLLGPRKKEKVKAELSLVVVGLNDAGTTNERWRRSRRKRGSFFLPFLTCKRKRKDWVNFSALFDMTNCSHGGETRTGPFSSSTLSNAKHNLSHDGNKGLFVSIPNSE